MIDDKKLAIKQPEPLAPEEVYWDDSDLELEELCKPIALYLMKNYHPYCQVIITDNQVRIVQDVLGIPINCND
ncbi:MAG: hypothetical protein RR942_15030 [Romboutsia sp.]